MKKLFPLLAAAALTLAACSPAEKTETPVKPVTPTPPAVVSVTGIEVPATLTMKVGETKTIPTTVLPADAANKNIKWSVYDSAEVATLDPATGTVTALSVGRTRITANTEDGNYMGICMVMVVPERDPDDVLTWLPDPVLRTWFRNEDGWRWHDADGNGKMSPAEAAAIDILNLAGRKLYSLEGIEHFTGLTTLVCDDNFLTSLDVSKNTKLTLLNCITNQITALDVSMLSELTELGVSKNRLTALDISKNTAMMWMMCDQNPGDGTIFPIKSWFDIEDAPSSSYFHTSPWYSGDKLITPVYQKVK